MDDLAEYAAAVAPPIDRARMAMMHAALAVGIPDSLRAAGLDPETGMLLTYLRNAYPDRVVDRASVRAVFTYQAGKQIDPGLDALEASGAVTTPAAGQLVLTDLGRSCLEDLHAVSDAAAQQLWAEHGDAVAVAGPLTAAALEEARRTGGTAFALMAPVVLPASLGAAGVLAERLTGLRFHRFDAHIDAWRAAGVADPTALESLDPPGRAAIEAETNRRAGAPYAVLDRDGRAALLEALTVLAG